MKSRLLLVFFFVFSLFSASVYADNIWFVEGDFCGAHKGEKELNLITKAGEENKLCMQFTNVFTGELSVRLWFVNAVVTRDAAQNRACSNMLQEKNGFGDFVEIDSPIVRIPAWSTMQKEFSVRFSPGFSWFSYGCLTYQLTDPLDKVNVSNSMFSVIYRKTKFVNFYVWDTVADTSVSLSGVAAFVTATWNLALHFAVYNSGNVTQNLSVSWTVSNVFGYSRSFAFPSRVIEGKQMLTFSTEDVSSAIDVPAYKGLYTISFQVAHTPQHVFDLRNPNKGITTSAIISYSLYLFAWSRQFVSAVVLLFAIVFFLLRPRKKKEGTRPSL